LKDLGFEEIIDEKTGQNLYDLATNLPFVFNQKEFNRQYDFLLSELSSSQLDYFLKMRGKKKNIGYRFILF